ncbi:hypothetical protein HHK36_026674 [Tetracentron sinense]|uniref:Peptidase A1 domain-containing protein n=1 Tax=Tetracentron sinense TaxID=13715 RepID=A0A835D2D6_TETSI|nr:hypothetical protein HHK36_026674 [Tetracentron sinense]
MASFLSFLLLFSLLLISLSHAQRHLKPNTLVLPVSKDGATHLYVTTIHKRTPLLPVPFVLDLNGLFLWVNCEHQYLSSTYRAPRCHSAQCSIANTHRCRTCPSPARPGCHNNTCSLVPVNPVTNKSGNGELAQDVLSIQLTDGSNSGPMVTVPGFLFACAPAFLLQGPLPIGVQGIAGLGRTQIALPTQLASHFGFRPKFALCLTSSASNGVIFFGDGPYMMLPGIDISQAIGHTPLVISPQGEYYIGVRSIRINNKLVPLNTSLLSKNIYGFSGTMISTVVPYTILETSIYKAVTQFFANELYWVHRVAPVAPFGVCFNSTNITSTRVGPGVPNIDLVLQNENVVWRIFGVNSMVRTGQDVLCLGFVDGGPHPMASIVIGGHQLEDNLLQFDLSRSSLGFSSSLLFRRTSCANFNFTSNS